MSKFWKQSQYRSGTSLRFSTARQQSTNGLAERVISVIDEVLSIYVNYKQDNWAALMPQIVYSINDTPDMTASHRRSPLFIEYGFNPRKPIDFLDSVPEARETDEDIDGAPRWRSPIFFYGRKKSGTAGTGYPSTWVPVPIHTSICNWYPIQEARAGTF
eukprot:SAG11_NODE_527_length_8731_cov_3.883457_1_plen_159_part_00